MIKSIYTVLDKSKQAECLWILNHPLTKYINVEQAISAVVDNDYCIIMEYVNYGKHIIDNCYLTTHSYVYNDIRRYISDDSLYLSNEECIIALDESYRS